MMTEEQLLLRGMVVLSDSDMADRTREIYSSCMNVTFDEQTCITVEITCDRHWAWHVRYVRQKRYYFMSRAAGRLYKAETVGRIARRGIRTPRDLVRALWDVARTLKAVSPEDGYLHTIKRPVLADALQALDPPMARAVLPLWDAVATSEAARSLSK